MAVDSAAPVVDFMTAGLFRPDHTEGLPEGEARASSLTPPPAWLASATDCTGLSDADGIRPAADSLTSPSWPPGLHERFSGITGHTSRFLAPASRPTSAGPISVEDRPIAIVRCACSVKHRRAVPSNPRLNIVQAHPLVETIGGRQRLEAKTRQHVTPSVPPTAPGPKWTERMVSSRPATRLPWAQTTGGWFHLVLHRALLIAATAAPNKPVLLIFISTPPLLTMLRPCSAQTVPAASVACGGGGGRRQRLLEHLTWIIRLAAAAGSACLTFSAIG